jgi:hypothetical protein
MMIASVRHGTIGYRDSVYDMHILYIDMDIEIYNISD